jgi:hypothetical protein
VNDQVQRLTTLPADASIETVAAALAQPVIRAMSGPPTEDRALMRIVAQTYAEPTADQQRRFQAIIARSDAAILDHLQRLYPTTPRDDLFFRTEAMTGVLHYIVMGRMRIKLDRLPKADTERLLVPILTATLAAEG